MQKQEGSNDESMSGSKSPKGASKTDSKTDLVARKDATVPAQSELGLAHLLHENSIGIGTAEVDEIKPSASVKALAEKPVGKADIQVVEKLL